MIVGLEAGCSVSPHDLDGVVPNELTPSLLRILGMDRFSSGELAHHMEFHAALV